MNDTYMILKKNKGKWMSSKDVSKYIDTSVKNITISLQKLRKYDKNIEIKERANLDGGHLWRLK